MSGQARDDSAAWRNQGGFLTRIDSARQLQTFNDAASFAISFDVIRSVTPAIQIVGNKNATLCLWETRSSSGFITKPRVHAGFITIRFITNGHIVYRHHASDALGTPDHATLVSFEDLDEVRASEAFSAINGTIAIETLAQAHAALTGEARGLPPLATVAEVDTPGMRALFCTLRQVQAQNRDSGPHGDLMLPLIQEIISYQLLSAWPLRGDPEPRALPKGPDASEGRLGLALDYIEANLSAPLTLADIASAAGISVRSLQDRFRRDLGQTPLQFILDRRLARVHRDLASPRHAEVSITRIANRWGFVHMSDFGQRYRRVYGVTPSDTRRRARSSG